MCKISEVGSEKSEIVVVWTHASKHFAWKSMTNSYNYSFEITSSLCIQPISFEGKCVF